MVEAELHTGQGILSLRATIVTYGNASSTQVAEGIAQEINEMWNAPKARITIADKEYAILFDLTAHHRADLDPMEVVSNTDPLKNFFRVEEFALGNISFVDGIGCNTGYFKLENLYKGSTTAAHEFGHTIGLDHPRDLDIRGQGQPGIMYPRGTWVDPAYQYDSTAQPGAPGGTMHPMHRRVLVNDIADLQLHRLGFKNGKAILGEFTNMWHEDHGGKL